MSLSSQIEAALKQASGWLVSIRREKGEWYDLVYKRQGILNIAEAWRSLCLIQSVVKGEKWESEWFKTDWQQLQKAIKADGFIRSPYCQDAGPHESVDAAAFTLLMRDGLAISDQLVTPPALTSLTRLAYDWLLKSQAEAGGWSWATPKPGRPLYPYFTYMAMKALAGVKAKKAQKAIERGLNWLKTAQLADGSFSVHSESDEPDVVSTAYAAIALGKPKKAKTDCALSRAICYLLSASLSELTQLGQLKIVEPDQPPQLFVSYENYSVPADVLLALVGAHPRLTGLPQLNDRIHFLVPYLLEQQASHGGWPATYSTIYVTHTVIEGLVAYLELNRRHPQLISQRPSSHYNPYIFGFPVQHPQRFFGREAVIERIRTDVNTGAAVKRDLALIGERRIGKTSLLYQLPHHLRADGHRVFYLDLQLIQSLEQFLQTFIAQLGQAVFELSGKRRLKTLFSQTAYQLDQKFFRELDIELQTPLFSLSTTARPSEMFRLFLTDIDKLLERFRKQHRLFGAKIIVLLDEIGALKHFAPRSFYSLLKGLAQHSPELVFIVADTADSLADITAFKQLLTPIHLGRLERTAAIELITSPVKGKIGYTHEAIEKLLETSKRHPYLLQVLCYHCLRWLGPDQTQVTAQIVGQVITQFKRQTDWEG